MVVLLVALLALGGIPRITISATKTTKEPGKTEDTKPAAS
jgi:hypothetical protein